MIVDAQLTSFNDFLRNVFCIKYYQKAFCEAGRES